MRRHRADASTGYLGLTGGMNVRRAFLLAKVTHQSTDVLEQLLILHEQLVSPCLKKDNRKKRFSITFQRQVPKVFKIDRRAKL